MLNVHITFGLALQELKKVRGTQLDEQIVDFFVSLVET